MAAPRRRATTSESYARQIADADHWDLRNVIAVVEIGPKAVPSIEGHRLATTSPYYAKRLELCPTASTRCAAPSSSATSTPSGR